MKNIPSIALTKCFFCGDGSEILIGTSLTFPNRQVEAADQKVIDMRPCTKCEGFMKQGVILITIDNAKSEPDWWKNDGSGHWMPNPWRTGGFFVVKDDAIKKAITPAAMVEWAIAHRWMFIEHAAAERMGLFELAKKQQEKDKHD